MMDEDKDHTRGAELVAQMEEALNLVFDEISFEMGFNGEKHELILTPEGDKIKLFELVYFQKHAPGEVLEHWNILVGRQPSPNTGLRTEDGWDISGEDVQIWLEEALAAGDGPEILTLTGVFTGFVLLSRGRTRGSSSGTCRKSGTSPWRNTTPAGKRPTTRWGSRWAICWPLSAWPTVLSPAARPTRKTTICGRMRSKQPGSTAPIFWWRCWAPTPTPMTRGTSWQVSPPMCWRTMWSSATGRPSASRRTTSTPSPAAPASGRR